ncbi:glycine zipper domain-containing protein [Variovorax sp. HJSM1_2]|uniref:glycine zipper domain-containing protein n=1 Tax=Variovorax sp. HJSM1_2 TaxID=3366263 RepID=UPI003BC0C7C4
MATAELLKNDATLGVHQIGTSLHNTIDRVADPTRAAIDRVSSNAHESVDRWSQRAETATETLYNQRQRLSQAPRQALAQAKEFVSDHPLQAVGGALVLGLLVGWLRGR